MECLLQTSYTAFSFHQAHVYSMFTSCFPLLLLSTFPIDAKFNLANCTRLLTSQDGSTLFMQASNVYIVANVLFLLDSADSVTCLLMIKL